MELSHNIPKDVHLAARYVNRKLKIEPDGEIINLDYDPKILYRSLQQSNKDKFDEELLDDIRYILKCFCKLGENFVKIFRTAYSNTVETYSKIGQLIQKYRITQEIFDARHMKRAITIPRLMLLFPHIFTKVSFDTSIIEASSVDMASCFCMLPKFKDDVEDHLKYKKIIKFIFFVQYSKQQFVQRSNKYWKEATPVERMEALVLKAKAIYNSDHISDNFRYMAYKTFSFRNNVFDHYEQDVKQFDEYFSEINPLIESIFELKDGTGIEPGEDIDEFIKTKKMATCISILNKFR